MSIVYLYIIGFVLDLIFGDPYFMPHPVKAIGKFISFNEKWIRKKAQSEKQMKRFGLLLLVLTSVCSMTVCFLVLYALRQLSDIAYYIGVIYFSYACLSTTCLASEAKKVAKKLGESLEQARVQVGFIVGRDTKNLTEKQIVKATVETVAENTTDGIIAPLIYLFIGGPVLAIGFKAVSTLDSMVGYKNDKYKDIGYYSAKFDDILNYVPARISGFLMCVAAFFAGFDFKSAFRVMKRDHANHLSPNCAWTESAAAGALGIMLGGSHDYFGKIVEKPSIGDDVNEPCKGHIYKINNLMYVTSVISLGVCILVYFGVSFLL